MEKQQEYVGVHVPVPKKVTDAEMSFSHDGLSKFLEGLSSPDQDRYIQNHQLHESLDFSLKDKQRIEYEAYVFVKNLSGGLKKVADKVLFQGLSYLDAQSMVILEQYCFDNLKKYFPRLCSKSGVGGAYVALKLEGHIIFRAEDYGYAKELLSKGEFPYKVLKIVRERSKDWEPSYSFPKNSLFS